MIFSDFGVPEGMAQLSLPATTSLHLYTNDMHKLYSTPVPHSPQTARSPTPP